MESEKRLIEDIVDYSLCWNNISIEKVEKDITELKKLGCTHVVMDFNYDDHGVDNIQYGYKQRLETDKEFSDRINISYIESKRLEERDLAEYERLKNKYNL